MVDYVKLENEEKEDMKKQSSKGFIPKIKEIRLIPDGINQSGMQRRGFSLKGFLMIFIVFFLISSVISGIIESMSPKVAVINLNGVIMTEGDSIYGEGVVSSKEFSKHIEKIIGDDTYKAVILDINSPGGAPVPSNEISKQIEELKKKKIPVYAVINDLGASGAYWIAVSTDKIYASDMSLIGSIGVTSSSLGFENLINDWNITYRRTISGKYKDMGTPFREPTNEEVGIKQALLDDIYNKFINHVAKSRNLSLESVEELATGEVFLGDKAKKLGLVDEIGGVLDVKKIIEEQIKEEPLYIDFGPEKTVFEELGLNSININIPNLQSQSSLLLK
jgi:protease IV